MTLLFVVRARREGDNMYSGWKGKLRNRKKCQLAAFLLQFVGEPMAKQSQQRNGGLALAAQLVDGPIWSTSVFRRDLHRISLCQYKASSLCCNKSCHHTLPPSKLHRLMTYNGNYHSEVHSCNGVSQRAFIKWQGWLNISDMLSARSVDFRREVKS